MPYSCALQSVLKAAGGPKKLADHLGIVPSAVTQWDDVPARHLMKVAALTGIPVEEIRPDLAPQKGEAA